MNDNDARKHLSIIYDANYNAFLKGIIDETDWDKQSGKAVYYCQVYKDENMEYEIDNFIIHKDELVNYKDYYEAEQYAVDIVKSEYSYLFEEPYSIENIEK